MQLNMTPASNSLLEAALIIPGQIGLVEEWLRPTC